MLLFIASAGKHFLQDGCLYRASSLAFTSLMALVPLMAVGIFILSFYPPIQFMGEKIEQFIFSNLVASSGETLEKYASQFSQQVLHMSWLGVIALFVVVALLMFSIENALNAIWKLPQRPGRLPILRALARHWFMLFLIPLLLGASLLLASYISSLVFMQNTLQQIHMPNALVILLPAVLGFSAFVAIYKFIPAAHVPWRHALVGGLVSTVLFTLSKQLFVLYIRVIPTYTLLYGAFAAVPLFLIWDYIVWLIILFSAEIVWLLGEQKNIPE